MAGFKDYYRWLFGWKSSHKTTGPGIEYTSVLPDAIPEYSAIGVDTVPEYSSIGPLLEYSSIGDAVAITLPQTRYISEGETRVVSIDLSEDINYAISSVSTPVEITTADLTLSGEAANAAVIVVNGSDVAIGYGVQFTVSGAQSGTDYRIRVTVTLSNSEVVVRDILLNCP